MKVKVSETKLIERPKVYGGEFQADIHISAQGLPEKVKAMIMTGQVVAGIFKAQGGQGK